MTEEEQLEALYGKMFENRVIDQTISERVKDTPNKKKQEPMVETEDDDLEEKFV